MAVRRCDDQMYLLGGPIAGEGASFSVTIPGGEYMFMATGTENNTTVSLQFQAPNGVWGDLYVFSGSPVRSSVLPYTQTGIDLPAGNVRLFLKGGTPVNIYAYLVGLG